MLQDIDDILNGRTQRPTPAPRQTGNASDAIKRIFEEEGADYDLGLAMGRQEGGRWDTRTSGAGAQGPLQVMPATGLRFVKQDEWDTPEGKIRAGARYTKYLSDRYNNDPYYVVGAYHAGEGKVDRYFKTGQQLPRSPEFYDRHANIYTPDHVEKVLRNYRGGQGQSRASISGRSIEDILSENPAAPGDIEYGRAQMRAARQMQEQQPQRPRALEDLTALAADPTRTTAQKMGEVIQRRGVSGEQALQDVRNLNQQPVSSVDDIIQPQQPRTLLTPRASDSTLTAAGRAGLAGLVGGGQRLLKLGTNLGEMAASASNPLAPAAGEALRAKLAEGEKKLAGDTAAQEQAYGMPGTVLRRGTEMVTAGAPALALTAAGVPAPLAFGGQAAAENYDRGAERALTEGAKAGLTVGMMGKAAGAISPLRDGVLRSAAQRLVAGGLVGSGAAGMELADQITSADGKVDARRAAEVGIPTAIITALLPGGNSRQEMVGNANDPNFVGYRPSAFRRQGTVQDAETQPGRPKSGDWWDMAQWEENAPITDKSRLLSSGEQPPTNPYEPPIEPSAPRPRPQLPPGGPQRPPAPPSAAPSEPPAPTLGERLKGLFRRPTETAPTEPRTRIDEVPFARDPKAGAVAEVGEEVSLRGGKVQITSADNMVVRFKDAETGQPGVLRRDLFERETGRPVAVQERAPRVETPSATEMPGGALEVPQAQPAAPVSEPAAPPATVTPFRRPAAPSQPMRPDVRTGVGALPPNRRQQLQEEPLGQTTTLAPAPDRKAEEEAAQQPEVKGWRDLPDYSVFQDEDSKYRVKATASNGEPISYPAVGFDTAQGAVDHANFLKNRTTPAAGETPPRAVMGETAPAIPAAETPQPVNPQSAKESDLLEGGWTKVDANRYTAKGHELVREGGKWVLTSGKRTRRFATLRDAIQPAIEAAQPKMRAARPVAAPSALPVEQPDTRSVDDILAEAVSAKPEPVTNQSKQLAETAQSQGGEPGAAVPANEPTQMTKAELVARYKPGNPFAEKAATARDNYNKLVQPTARDKAMANSFPLGGGFARPGDAKRIDASITRAAKAQEYLKEAQYREAQAQAYDEGKINAQGRRPAKNADQARERREMLKERAANAWAQREGKQLWESRGEVVADSARQFGGPGRALVLEEHKDAVRNALSKGQSVPPEVLADYPDLAAQYGKSLKSEPETQAQPQGKAAPTGPSPTEATQSSQPPITPEPKQAKSLVASHQTLFERVRNGEVKAAEFKAAFEAVVNNKAEIAAELLTLTKDGIFEKFPHLQWRHKNETKAEIASAAYSDMLADFTLGEGVSYMLGGRDAYTQALRKMVDKVTDESLAQYAEKVKQARAEREAERKAALEGLEDPQTLEDFQRLMNVKAKEMGEGVTFQQVRMSLTPEQRVRFDDLVAEKTRGERRARADQRKTEIRPASQSMTGQVIETKHTKTGEPLFVVKAAERVERDVYNQWNATAKRMGGWYSSYRGGGAVPGFQFKTRENAEAFLAYLGGNIEQAQEAAQTRRDAMQDDKSQTAVERLREMADALEARADEALTAERKVNTARRARFAASAEAAANADKAMAETMRNIANAIESGKAKLLDQVRQKVQVEMLQGFVHSGYDEYLRTKYPSYGEREKHLHSAPTREAADYATFPSYTAYRSDLAKLGRQLSEKEGTKKLGAALLKVADDVTAAYLKFAKENLPKVSTFSRKDGARAVFASKETAEHAISRSGYKGKAIVLPFKRGQNIIILSPAAAREQGIWEGDDDKRITLSAEMGAEIVEKTKSLSRREIDVPWTFEAVYDKRKRLAGMGIETAAELRAALREFIGLREQPKAPDKIKEMERAMIGRRNDGLDFFPTPASVAERMIEAAELSEGMTVLEPSAGMGHIADLIREAGVEPDVLEMAGDRRELLEAKGYTVLGPDFMKMNPRGFTYGDIFRHTDGTLGVMRGSGGMGSNRVGFIPKGKEYRIWVDREDLTGVRKVGTNSGYDRIIMNPPFSQRRDIEHVRHAYEMLRPGGRLVAIIGEGSFSSSDKKAAEFRDWLESVGGTSEKLEEGSFLDPSLPVNTGANARMVVVDRPDTRSVSDVLAETVQDKETDVAATTAPADALGREKVEPAKDTVVGKNAASETLYRRADGSLYRMRMDRQDKPQGYPDFGGDLSQAETEQSDDRAKIIDEILQAARKPLPTIIERVEYKGTDGNWYSPIGGSPRGVSLTDEKRSVGFVFQGKDGVTYGNRESSREALITKFEKGQDEQAVSLRASLEDASPERLQSQAEYWLKRTVNLAGIKQPETTVKDDDGRAPYQRETPAQGTPEREAFDKRINEIQVRLGEIEKSLRRTTRETAREKLRVEQRQLQKEAGVRLDKFGRTLGNADNRYIANLEDVITTGDDVQSAASLAKLAEIKGIETARELSEQAYEKAKRAVTQEMVALGVPEKDAAKEALDVVSRLLGQPASTWENNWKENSTRKAKTFLEMSEWQKGYDVFKKDLKKSLDAFEHLSKEQKAELLAEFDQRAAKHPNADNTTVRAKTLEQADMLNRQNDPQRVVKSTRALQPLSTLKLKPGTWGGRKGEVGEFITDGHMLVRRSLLKNTRAFESRIQEGRYADRPSQEMQKGLWDTAENSFSKLYPAQAVGYYTDDKGRAIAVLLGNDADVRVDFDAHFLLFLKKHVGYDQIRVSRDDGPAVFAQKGKAVAVAMPFRTGGYEIDIPTARKMIKGELSSLSPDEALAEYDHGAPDVQFQAADEPVQLTPADWKTASKDITKDTAPAEIFEAMRAFFRPADGRISKNVVVGNKATTAVLLRGLEAILENSKLPSSASGMMLHNRDVRWLVDYLQYVSNLDIPNAKNLGVLLDALRQASENGDNVFYVDADPKRTRRDVEKTVQHEVEMHGWQVDTDPANLGLVSADWMRADKDYRQIVRHLRNLSYDKPEASAAIEALAYIGSGDWEKIGYTGPRGEQRAADFVERYLREVVKNYGVFAVKRLKLGGLSATAQERVINEQEQGAVRPRVSVGTGQRGREVRQDGRGREAAHRQPQSVDDILRGSVLEGRGTGSQAGDSRSLGEGESREIVPFEPAFATIRDVFGVDDVKGTLTQIRDWSRESLSDVRSVVNPMGRGSSARETASIVRDRAAELARKTDQAEAKLRDGRKLLMKLDWPQRRAFIYAIETGAIPQLPSELQPIANLIRQTLDEHRQEVQNLGTGKLQSYYQDYFPHIWKDPKKAQQVFHEYFGKRPFQGSKSFLKQRTVPTIEHGIAMGLEPVSQDPVELVMLKLREMDRYVMAHLILQEMQDKGLLVRIKATHRVPDGYGKINDSVGTIFGAPVNGALTIRGYWVGPEPAVNVINNYLSPGLRKFAPFRGYLNIANAMNQFQLGFSAFHLGFTSLDAAISRAALGLHEITHGRPLAGVGSLLSTPISPITNILKGRKVYKAWETPGAMGPEWDAIADAVQAGGGRVKMDSFYATQITKKMREAFAKKNIPGVAAGLFRAPFALVEQASRPIMEYIVPRQKLGVFADLARHELDKLGPNASREDVRRVMAKAWDSVDNRMGQMVYDNLFWHKAFKDLTMASVRSVGWNLGTKREVLGGAVDFAKFGTNVAARVVRSGAGMVGAGGRIPPAPPRRPGGTGEWFEGNPEITYRMEYVIAMTLVVGAFGAMLNYLFTGERPKEMKDYFFPRTGNMDENGRPERLSLPAYVKDIYHYYHDASRTALNKLHPLLNTLGEIWSNKDFYGTEVWNADDPPAEKAQEMLLHVAKSFQPFAYRGMVEERDRGSDWRKALLPFVGLTPAPSSINKTDAENLMDEIGRARRPVGTRTKEEAEAGKLRRNLVRELRRGASPDSTLGPAVRAGQISTRQADEAVKRAHTEPLTYQFNHLGLSDALRVWDKMTPDERDKVRPILRRKAANAVETRPAEEIKLLMPRLREALK